MLRQFLYLDRQLVREFLAQLEGGVYDESRELTAGGRNRGINAKLSGGPAQAGIERTKSTQAESEAVVKQTSASEFDRLYTQLEDAELQIYDTVDEKLDTLPIKRKDIVEVDARLRVSGLHTVLDLVGKINQFLPLMESLGTPGMIDQEAIEGMQAFATLAGASRSLPLIATVPGDCGLQVALELKSDGLQSDDWDVEATVVFKVQRLLRPGDRHMVGDPFSGLMKIIPEDQRQQMLAGLQSDDLASIGVGETEISYPGIVGTPIAIYR